MLYIFIDSYTLNAGLVQMAVSTLLSPPIAQLCIFTVGHHADPDNCTGRARTGGS